MNYEANPSIFASNGIEELQSRNAARLADAIDMLGERYVFHPENKLPDLDEQRRAMNEAVFAMHVPLFIMRK